MMNSVLIVTNFNAGRKKAVKYKKRVIDFVLKHTKTFKCVNIDELKTIDISEYDTILTMGGDGTVNKLLPFIINTDKVLGIIPTGTANLLASKLGISSDLNKALQCIESGEKKDIDCLNINGDNCILRCGFGWDSDIICKTPQSLKNKFGYFAYFIAGILFALRLKTKEYDIKFDNEQTKIKASCIIIANASNMYKNLVSVTDNSYLDDGITDVFILKTTNPVLFFIEFILTLLKIRKNSTRAEYRHAKNIIIENNWIASHIDGEKHNIKENVNITVNPKSVKVFAPL